MTAARLGLIITGSLAVGFVAGWILHHPFENLSSSSSTKGSLEKSIANPAQPGRIAIKRSHTQEATTSPPAALSVSERLAALRWFKGNGLSFNIPLFNGEDLSPEFILFYGLTPTETTQLKQTFKEAKQRLNEIAGQRAQLDPASTDGKVVVTVPSFPVEGGQAYNDLLASLSSVLGPERYAVFNDISSDSLDGYFDGFGMAINRYDITLTKTEQGPPMFIVQKSFSMPNTTGSGGDSSGMSINTLDAASMVKHFPLLVNFPLPVTPSATPKEFQNPFIRH